MIETNNPKIEEAGQQIRTRNKVEKIVYWIQQ